MLFIHSIPGYNCCLRNLIIWGGGGEKKSKIKLDTIANKKIDICTKCYWSRRGLVIGDQEFSQNKEKSLDENLLREADRGQHKELWLK